MIIQRHSETKIRIEGSIDDKNIKNKLTTILNFLQVSGYSVGLDCLKLEEKPKYAVNFIVIGVVWFNNATEDIISIIKELTNETE